MSFASRTRSLLATLCLAPLLQAGELVPKQAAAPAEDIRSGLVRLPERVVEGSTSALLPLEWTRVAKGWKATLQVPVEQSGELSVALVGSDVPRWQTRLRGPGLPPVLLRRLAALDRAQRKFQALDQFAPGWTAEGFVLEEVPAGSMTVEVHSPGTQRPGPGLFAVGGSPDLVLNTSIEGWRWTSDRDVALRAWLAGPAAGVDEALVQLDTPFGPLAVPMLDDGFGADEIAGDGIFAAWIPRQLEGRLFARMTLRGHTQAGERFVRTQQRSLHVLPPRANLTGAVRTTVLGDGALALDLNTRTSTEESLQASFELWGHDGSKMVPVVWLSRMSFPTASGEHAVRFVLDTRWWDIAGVKGNFELRNLRLQDPHTHVVLDRIERLALEPDELPRKAGAPAVGITPDMLSSIAGSAPLPSIGGLYSQAGSPQVIPENPALMLVHGYCAGGSPWPFGEFTAPKRAFSDPNQNRSHDQFANLLRNFAENQGLDSFGVVAHSQGGAAALHLLTYYQSGLDAAVGERLIQSVGTPYQGTPLASLGSFACGVNNDLTPTGATAWLAGIPAWARAEVHYWTTSNSGSVCNFFSNLVLSSPNDGTTEQSRGQLPGANSRGHEIGWCHTTGMSNPAQYFDSVRNAEMNALAAR